LPVTTVFPTSSNLFVFQMSQTPNENKEKERADEL